MFTPGLLLFCLWAELTSSLAATTPAPSAPSVVLDKGTFVGTVINNTNAFLGIPFAQPPYVILLPSRCADMNGPHNSVGNLRFAKPVAPEPYEGTYDATNFGNVCPQDLGTTIGGGGSAFLDGFVALYDEFFPTPLVNQSEDCEYLRYQCKLSR